MSEKIRREFQFFDSIYFVSKCAPRIRFYYVGEANYGAIKLCDYYSYKSLIDDFKVYAEK